jgi:hypothetical protein
MTEQQSHLQTKQENQMKKIEKRIVVVQAGWVFVGEYFYDDVLKCVRLTNASCIRVWGTTAGLGQLALKGKQKETVLDFAGVVDVPLSSVVATVMCDPEVWA